MRPLRTLTRRSIGALAAASVAGRARAAPTLTVPMRIGVLTELGGPYAEDSGRGSVAAARFAVEDFWRQQPGLAPNFTVEVVSADAQTKPDVAAAVAGAWYDRDGVDMIIDVPVSNCALAVAGVARSRNKVAIFNTSTSDLTGKACSPNHVHWAFDTYALSASTARAMLADGGDTWFLIQTDYTFGAVLAAEAAAVVQGGGGRMLGTVRHPFPGTTDFSSYLLAAQASGAKVIGLANAGADAANCIKQAAEFGLTGGGVRLAALQCLLPSIHGIGAEAAQGLYLTESFYWDADAGTRAFSDRFAHAMPGTRPCMIHAGCYAGVLHYLKAVASLGPEAARADGAAVVAEMKRLPTDDPLFGKGRIREDGRKIHDMHLYRVKPPAASHGSWDLYDLVRTTPGEQAFRPVGEGGCPLVHS